jgi:predicted ATPase
MISILSIRNYRSLRDVCFELSPLTVITGPNGSGKSNIFRALNLLKAAALGRFAESLAAEGGMPGALFAGPESINREQAAAGIIRGSARQHRIELALGLELNELRFELITGLPPQTSHEESFFTHDPDIKSEQLWRGKRMPKNTLLARKAMAMSAGDGATGLSSHESMLWQLADHSNHPELAETRSALTRLRLYHGFATEAHSVIRQLRIGFRSDYLNDDGSNLSSVIANIQMIGDIQAFDDAIVQAFPGAKVRIERDGSGRFHLLWQQFGLLRALTVAELSDGTLRYLCLLAALHAPRASDVMAFNEPELSLYPELLAPLAKQFRLASQRSQIIVVSHAEILVNALEDFGDAKMIRLKRDFGATIVDGQGLLSRPSF